MDKKTKQQITTVGTGILIGSGITYAIMKDGPCEGCTCEKKL